MFTNSLPTEKRLTLILPKHSGRNNQGKVTVRGQGGRNKRYLRKIDFIRNKKNVPALLTSIEYDPNRTAYIGLLLYSDGEKRYILLPEGLKINTPVISGDQVEITPGNALPLKNIPIGTLIHNIELDPGKGGQLIRSAGTAGQLLAKEGNYAQVKMPSGEVRKISVDSYATIGQISNVDWKNKVLGKAGASRRRGIRPTVRGVAQNPRSHPHGGGEGRSGIGLKSPKSPWGKRTLGKKTRRKVKYSDKLILKRRK